MKWAASFIDKGEKLECPFWEKKELTVYTKTL